MHDLYDQDDDIVEKLRQLAWAVPICRDNMLKVVEEMPDFVRERAPHTAEGLTLLCAQLQGFLKKLPEGVVLPADVTEDLDCLRRAIEGTLRGVDLLLADLRLFLEPADEAHRKLYN